MKQWILTGGGRLTQGQIERVPKDIFKKVSHAICQSASIFFCKKVQKLGKSEKSSQFFRGKKVWNELLSKYMIYVPNVRWIHALKLFLEANGKFDGWKIQKWPKNPKKKEIQNSEKNSYAKCQKEGVNKISWP